MKPRPPTLVLCLVLAQCVADAFAREPDPSSVIPWTNPRLASLDDLAVPALRARPYGSSVTLMKRIDTTREGQAYQRRFSADGTLPYATFLAGYESDGLQVFTRIDVPATPAPSRGYPVVIFVHGWVGEAAAPGFDFAHHPDSISARAIDAWVDRGFMVISPALRGHGTVNGRAADGIEFLQAWDNATYLSPMFYAIDVLNLLAGLDSIEAIEAGQWGLPEERTVKLDLDKIHISGHSQGADAALAALAVSGEGSGLLNPLTSGSLWSGCFAPRFEQLSIYRPMAQTLEAFMSGDGSWNSTAIGADGSINPDFRFGWPPDWIGTTDTTSEAWTWQADTWGTPTVRASLQQSLEEAYARLNQQVADLGSAWFDLVRDASGKTMARHDPEIEAAMARIGGYGFPEFLTEPILLHHSDQDYYALPRWNADLAADIRQAGGKAWEFTYPANTHSLTVSRHKWFSPPGTREGFGLMIDRDVALMLGGDPASINTVSAYPPAGQGSVPGPASLEALADQPAAPFETLTELDPIDGMSRRLAGFSVDGLTQYALIVQPAGDPPADGWPVLIANHGYHPWPQDNGRRTVDGVTERPGDYYRGMPEDFAQRGFLMVWPDYRGHNVSQGGEFTASKRAMDWYARDSVAAFQAASALPGTNPKRMYLWGHSMGSGVTLRAALALGSRVAGVSVWSTFATDLLSQLSAIQAPLIIHHSQHETVLPFAESMALAKALRKLGKPHALYPYDSDAHLLTGVNRQLAVERDTQWFNRATGPHPGHEENAAGQ